MATGIYIPIWGLQMEEATLSSWLVEEGREVAKGQGVALIETYKISGEVESPADGVLRRQVGRVGQLLKVGELVGVVGAASEDEAEIRRVVEEEPLVTGLSVTEPKTTARETAPAVPPVPAAPAAAEPAAASQTPLPSTGPVRATPLARKMARDKGLNLARDQRQRPRRGG